MKKFILLSFLIFGCAKSTDFVQPVPVPESNIIDRIYALDVSYSKEKTADVDIIWVIDNSSSMSGTQAEVRRNAANFMNQFTQSSLLRWKMGLISTDYRQAPFIGFAANDTLDYQSTNVVTRFQNAVTVLGRGGSDTEQTYKPVLDHLRTYPNFLRDNAYLAFIIVTDEPEYSDVDKITGDFFLSEIKRFKGNSLSKVLTYGIFSATDVGCAGFSLAFSRYDILIKQTTSKVFPLCSKDYGTLLSQLGSDLVSKIQNFSNRIVLDERPNPLTIEVYFRGIKLRAPTATAAGQWSYNPVDNVVLITDQALLKAGGNQFRIVYERQFLR